MALTLHRCATHGGAWDVAHRVWADRGGLLVVPDRPTADRQLARAAAAGPVSGRTVITMQALRDRVLAGAAHTPTRPASRVAVRLALQQALADTPAPALGASVDGPGFLGALERAVTEIREAGVDPGGLVAAAHDPVSADIARLVAALAALPLPADDRWRAARAAGGTTSFAPLVIAGADDLSPPVWALARALGRVTAVDVVTPHTPGRRAHGARWTRQEAWAADADAVVAHPGPPSAGDALFEDRAGPADPRTLRLVGAAGTRGMHRTGLLEVLAAHEEGVPLSDCALVVPALAAARDDLDRLLADWGVPARRDTRRSVLETPIGVALLHLLALGERGPDDPGALNPLLGWLRGPYSGADPAEVDALERDARRGGLDERRLLIGRMGAPLAAARRLVAASRRGTRAQLAAMVEVGEEGLARVAGTRMPGHADLLDRLALAALAGLLDDADDRDDAGDAPPRPRGPLPPGALGRIIADLTVPDRSGPPHGLAVLDPVSLRGRAFRVVVLCGLDGDGIPAGPPPDALLGGLRAPSGPLPARAPGTAEARLRFTHAVDAAAERLVLVRRVVDDEGREVAPSPYWMEACRVFGRPPGALDRRTGGRGEVLDRDDPAPCGAEALRRLARDGKVVPGALARAASRRVRRLGLPPGAFDDLTEISVTSVESFLRCAYGWFHERHLRPRPLEPPFDAAAEGSLGHEVVQRVYARIAAGPDPGPCDAGRLEAYRTALREELALVLAEHAALRNGPAFQAFGARLGVHLDLMLCTEAASSPRMAPVAFEHTVGDDALLGVSPPLRLGGTLDRLDADPDAGHVVVVDYKRSGRSFTGREPLCERMQPALYGLMAGGERGARPMGGLYVGLLGGRRDGLVSDAARYADRLPSGQVVDAGEWDRLVGEAVEGARAAARALRAGVLEGPPSGGCKPWCRCGVLWR